MRAQQQQRTMPGHTYPWTSRASSSSHSSWLRHRELAGYKNSCKPSHTRTVAGGHQATGGRAIASWQHFCDRDSHGPAHTGVAAGGHQATRARAPYPGSMPPRWQLQPAKLRCPHPVPAQAACAYLQADSDGTLRRQGCTPEQQHQLELYACELLPSKAHRASRQRVDLPPELASDSLLYIVLWFGSPWHRKGRRTPPGPKFPKFASSVHAAHFSALLGCHSGAVSCAHCSRTCLAAAGPSSAKSAVTSEAPSSSGADVPAKIT